jgi:hypothetical protein
MLTTAQAPSAQPRLVNRIAQSLLLLACVSRRTVSATAQRNPVWATISPAVEVLAHVASTLLENSFAVRSLINFALTVGASFYFD